MPARFLTDEQRQRYGRFADEPSSAQLDHYFLLNDANRALIFARRGNRNRLGFAIQLGTVRFLGTFLLTPTAVPVGVIAFVAQQLQIDDLSCLGQYLDRSPTHREPAGQILNIYRYLDFSAQPTSWRFVRWLYSRAWVGTEAPSVLFDLATVYLVERKILLPGVKVLERLVANVRERAAEYT
jgi:TnpA family transposase